MNDTNDEISAETAHDTRLLSTSSSVDSTNEIVLADANSLCPFCAEKIKSQAIKCKHCGSSLMKNSNAESNLTENCESTNQTGNTGELSAFTTIEAYLASLPPNDLAVVNAERASNRRNVPFAYYLLVCFGVFGAHRFYLNRAHIGTLYIIMLCIPVVGWLLLALRISLDLFEIPKQVSDAELDVTLRCLARLGKPYPGTTNGDIKVQNSLFNNKQILALCVFLTAAFITALLVHRFTQRKEVAPDTAPIKSEPEIKSNSGKAEKQGHFQGYYAPAVLISPMKNAVLYTPVGDGATIPRSGSRKGIVDSKSDLLFKAKLNDKVYNLLDGIVTRVGYTDDQSGVEVEIYHPYPDVTVTYTHLNAYAVMPGVVVQRGRVIGYAGSTGKIDRTALGIKVVNKGGAHIDPKMFIRMIPRYQTALEKAKAKDVKNRPSLNDDNQLNHHVDASSARVPQK